MRWYGEEKTNVLVVVCAETNAKGWKQYCEDVVVLLLWNGREAEG